MALAQESEAVAEMQLRGLASSGSDALAGEARDARNALEVTAARYAAAAAARAASAFAAQQA